MPFDINGFFGKEALKMSEQIYEEHKKLFEFCYEVNRFAQRTISEFKINNLNPQEIFSACFLVKVIKGAQAAIILTEKGLDLEGAIVLRTVSEVLAFLILCINTEEFPEKYMRYSEVERIKKLNNILRNKFYEINNRLGDEAKIKREISELEEKFSKKEKNILREYFSKKNIYEKAGMLSTYDTFYSVTSDYVHTSIEALNEYIEFNNKSDISQFNYGPSYENASINLTAAAEFTLSALSYACKLFKKDKNKEIEDYHEELKKL